MSKDTYMIESRRKWRSATASLFGKVLPQTAVWTGALNVVNALSPVMGKGNNHAFLPGTGGGVDFEKVFLSRELGLIDFYVSGVYYRLKPKDLIFEVIEKSPHDSFFLLDLEQINDIGLYPDSVEYRAKFKNEEFVDCNGLYHPRSSWDSGLTEDGEALPENGVLVCRYLSGKILLACKSGLWNSIPDTYDAPHDNLTSSQIRSFIESRI